MKQIMAIGVILACHASAFIAMYYGRLHHFPLCGSDIFLIYAPLIFAVTAYASVYRTAIHTRYKWLHWVLVLGASAFSGIVSMAIGMTFAFNQWGT